MGTREAIDFIVQSNDHGVWSPEDAREIAEALNFPIKDIPVSMVVDNRSEFKGLRLYGINPKTGEEFKEGDSTSIVDPLKFMSRMTAYFKLETNSYSGRGFQYREYSGALHKHFIPPTIDVADLEFENL